MNSITRGVVCLGFLCAMLPGASFADTAANRCDHHVAQWLEPRSGDVLDSRQMFDRLAAGRVVLLGEEHLDAGHHRWQAYVMAALHSRQPDMVLGFEMLPRRAQPVLDAWSAGALGEKALLDQTRWREVWGYDAELYMPLFRFAREHRLPTLAMNVDRELIARVGTSGWKALSAEQREGLSDPAPASAPYRASLARLYAYKHSLKHGVEPTPMEDIEQAVVDETLRSEAFSNFVDAQLTWDRAMAEALADAHRRDPDALLVGIVGRGHLEFGYGIPHQLAALGVEDVSVLLPLSADDICDPLPADLANAVFIVDAELDDEPAQARPRLGVLIATGEGGVRVSEVLDDSVAASSGLLADDVITSAAGFPTATPAALIEVVGRQAPGTWLPLTVLREGERHDIVARFPQSFAVSP